MLMDQLYLQIRPLYLLYQLEYLVSACLNKAVGRNRMETKKNY